MSDIYLIKKETLTAIADAILDQGHLYVSDRITPENMPEAIGYVYDTGYDTGYNEGKTVGYDTGYSEGENNAIDKYAPIILQERSSTNDYGYYNTSVFGEGTHETCLGNTYCFSDFIEQGTTASSSLFTLTLINNTAFDVRVRVFWSWYGDIDRGSGTLEIDIAPNALKTSTVWATEQGVDLDWRYEIEGVIFFL